MAGDKERLIVGCEEWCAFPSLGIPGIKARVDSGAKTSSLHAFNINAFIRGKVEWVSFEVHPLQANRRLSVKCESRVLDRRSVKNSSGVPEKRYVIGASLKLGGESLEVELTLANRDSMGYRMLLGREAMSGRMLVDPEASFCLGDIPPGTIEDWYGPLEEERGLRIALLASNPNRYSNRRLMDAGQERGHEMEFLDIKQCFMRLDAERPGMHYHGGKVLDGFDAIITRVRPGFTYYGCAIVRQFEQMGVLTLNTSAAIAQSRDRLFALGRFLESGLPIPTTGFANAPNDTDDLINLVGGPPVIVKPLEDESGKGAVLAQTQAAAESVVQSFMTLGASLLVQHFIDNPDTIGIRCVVIGGRVVAAVQRAEGPRQSQIGQHDVGGVSVIKLNAEERSLAVKAARSLRLKIAGVDFLRTASGPILLDANATPGLEGIESATGRDIAAKMIGAVEKKLGWAIGALPS